MIEDAIKYQLTHRVNYDAAGNMLCRHCNKIIPDDFKFVVHDPDNTSVVWGPCCSEECLCYLKICSHCYKDFIIDKEGDITYQGDGIWLCQECESKIEKCSRCNSKMPLVESPAGKICNKCYTEMFFTCVECKQVHSVSKEQKEDKEKYSHVLQEHERYCTKCYNSITKDVVPLKIKICDCCHNKFSYKRDTGYNYCPSCIKSKNVRKCSGCDKYHHRWDSYNNGNDIFCGNCQKNLIQCEGCSKYVLNKDSKKHKGKLGLVQLCSDCYINGQECPKCFSFSTIYDDGTCKRCKSKLNYCNRCKQYHFDEGKCRILQTNVSNYSYKPLPYFNFLEKENTSVFFGFENEINYEDSIDKDRALRIIYSSYPATQMYLKSDGSIEGYGFEVVSQPMTLGFFNNLNLGNLFTERVKNNDKSCGLHVHLSKKAFDGQAHLYKFMDFINNANVKSIAGRDFNSYAQQLKEKSSKYIKDKNSRERYHSVNLTNPHTYEVRIFRGAKNEVELRYRIEFTLALVEFTRCISIKESKSFPLFKAYVKKHKKTYPNLYTFLER